MWFRKYDLVLVAFVMSMFFFIIDTLRASSYEPGNRAMSSVHMENLMVTEISKRPPKFYVRALTH